MGVCLNNEICVSRRNCPKSNGNTIMETRFVIKQTTRSYSHSYKDFARKDLLESIEFVGKRGKDVLSHTIQYNINAIYSLIQNIIRLKFVSHLYRHRYTSLIVNH